MIEWFDGFDQYGDVETLLNDGLWAQADDFVLSTVQARTGSRSLAMTVIGAYGRRALTNEATNKVGMGCAIFMDRLPIPPFNAPRGASVIQQFRNEANRSHISIQVGPTGKIYIMGGGMDRTSSTVGPDAPVELARSTRQIAAGAWNHIETIVEIGVGVQVRVNGKPFVQYTGTTDFAQIGDSNIAQIAIGKFDDSIPTEFNVVWWDDIFVQQGADIDFLGQLEVHYLRPVADQLPQEWQYTTGTNGYSLINEIPPDDDVDYIFSENAEEQARFEVEELPVGIQAVEAVAPFARVRKTDSGDCEVKLSVHSAGTLGEAPDTHAPTTAYQYFFDIFTTDPGNEDGPWTPTVMPAIQIERTL